MSAAFQAGTWRAFVRTTGAAGAITGIGLGAQLLLLRELPAGQAGRFATLAALTYALGVLGSLGQGTLMARVYQREADDRDWLRDLRQAGIIAAGAIVPVAALALRPIYDLTALEVMVIAIAGVAFAVTHGASSILAQRQQYLASSLLVRLPNFCLAAPALVFVARPEYATLRHLLPAFLAGFFLSLVAAGAILHRAVPRGSRVIGWKERREGLLFFGSALSLVVPDRGLIAVAGAVLPSADVAALAAVAGIVRLIDLVTDSTGRVLSTEMARTAGRLSSHFLVPLWSLAAVLAIGLLAGLPPLIHWLYQGRFDRGLSAAPWLIVAAALTLIETLPRGFLAYRAARPTLIRHVTCQALIAAAGLTLSIPLADALGVKGIALAAAGLAAARAVSTYSFARGAERPSST